MASNNQDDHDGGGGSDSRLERFQAKCAAMRAITAAELARLAKKRSDTRLRVGVTSEQMNQWLAEHQQLQQLHLQQHHHQQGRDEGP